MMLAPEKAKEIRESEDGKERFWSIISQVCKHDSRKVSILFTTKLYFYKKKKMWEWYNDKNPSWWIICT